jgi:methanogenic corrinoid protein MtbC1
MPESRKQEKLIQLIADLQEEEAIELTQELINSGKNPLDIVDICHMGMREVGRLYEQGTYFITGLIMAGEIMRQISKMLTPLLDSRSRDGSVGNIIIGTVEGDIHFIGKDIIKNLLRVNGFSVHDLGVDVSPGAFLSAVHEFKPDLVGLSCLINAAYEPMQETIALLRKNVPGAIAPRAYIIGGRVDDIISKQVNADLWANNAMVGVRLCRQVMAVDK